jgi:hypothetical protein
MQITKTFLLAALAAFGVAATAAEAQNPLSRGSGDGGGAGMARSAPARVDMGGASRGNSSAGPRDSAGASGGHHGNWNGRTVASGGRHWGGGGRHWGGGRGHYRGSRGYWGPRLGVYIGAPLLFGAYYWGSPYWDDYYYPRSTVVYRERIVEPYPMTYPDSYVEEESTTAEILPRAEGAPTQAPAYRNYCESAKAYYPKVTTCPEGWRFEPAPSR